MSKTTSEKLDQRISEQLKRYHSHHPQPEESLYDRILIESNTDVRLRKLVALRVQLYEKQTGTTDDVRLLQKINDEIKECKSELALKNTMKKYGMESAPGGTGGETPDINDEDYTPPLRAAQIYSTLRIDRGTLQKNKPLGKLFAKHCNNGTARLPWGDFWATAKGVVERSKSDLERDLLTDLNTFKELFLMP